KKEERAVREIVFYNHLIKGGNETKLLSVTEIPQPRIQTNDPLYTPEARDCVPIPLWSCCSAGLSSTLPCASGALCRPPDHIASLCRPLDRLASLCRPLDRIASLCRPLDRIASLCRPPDRIASLCSCLHALWPCPAWLVSGPLPPSGLVLPGSSLVLSRPLALSCLARLWSSHALWPCPAWSHSGPLPVSYDSVATLVLNLQINKVHSSPH
ncbi:uncharacterized protein LOC129362964, partial [Poeciliopsis prolifica]|uniref:uncharacterized protein LOC129362964 n=1 Tax=Poeciliopsis prolifica TaxID=188132 RepID=UPI00241383F9